MSRIFNVILICLGHKRIDLIDKVDLSWKSSYYTDSCVKGGTATMLRVQEWVEQAASWGVSAWTRNITKRSAMLHFRCCIVSNSATGIT
jgi:hypothetical protein